MATVEDASAYFASRLNTDAWDNASEPDKQKAISQAERQINTLRLREDVNSQAKSYAVYEQALFLLQMTPYDHERERAQALGVVGGSVGKANEYSTADLVRRKMSEVTISPEAMAYIGEYVLGRNHVKVGRLV